MKTSRARGAVDAERHLPDLATGQPGRVRGSQLQTDLAARVSDADDQDTAASELRRIAIVRGVQLEDARIEVRGERGHPGLLVAAHRDHHVVRLEPGAVRDDGEAVAVPLQSFDPDAGANREVVMDGVGLKVVSHLVLGRESIGRPGKRHPGQRVVARGTEQAKRVPARTPGVADALMRVEDHER